MKPTKNIEKSIRQLQDRTGAELDARTLTDACEVLAKKQQTQSASNKPNIWRIIMKSKMTKLAAVAAIIIAAIIGINHFGGSVDMAGVAWGEVGKKVKAVTAFKCYQYDKQTDIEKNLTNEKEMVMYISSDYGQRLDSYKDGEIWVSTYALPRDRLLISVMPKAKKYARQTLSEKAVKEMGRNGPREMVARFMATEYKKLGRKQIGEVEVEGIEVYDATVIDGPEVESFIGRLWVDRATELPVLLESEIVLAGGKVKLEVILDRFEWNVKLERSIFEPHIPEDYTDLYSQEESAGRDKALSPEEQKEKAKVKEIALNVFQACVNGDLEALFEFLPHEMFKPQVENYEFLSGLEVVNIKEPCRENGSSKWAIPYKVKLKSGSVREENLYIAYWEKSKRYIVTGGLKK